MKEREPGGIRQGATSTSAAGLSTLHHDASRMQATRETSKIKLSPICDSKSQIVVQAEDHLPVRVVGGLVLVVVLLDLAQPHIVAALPSIAERCCLMLAVIFEHVFERPFGTAKRKE
jgi:hypothetical protein